MLVLTTMEAYTVTTLNVKRKYLTRAISNIAHVWQMQQLFVSTSRFVYVKKCYLFFPKQSDTFFLFTRITICLNNRRQPFSFSLSRETHENRDCSRQLLQFGSVLLNNLNVNLEACNFALILSTITLYETDKIRERMASLSAKCDT